MKQAGLASVFVTLMLTVHVAAQSDRTPVTILPDEVASERVSEWMSYRYGLFIHFNINTYLPKGQHVEKTLPVSVYEPTSLDVDGWIKLARDAGMKYSVLTVKHDGGFCLWDSKVTFEGKEFSYDVAATEYKTDVVQAFVDACREYGIAPGFYYCLSDSYADKTTPLRTQFKRGQMKREHFELAKSHLKELMARYPSCEYYWLDTPKAATFEQQGILYDLIRRTKPEAVVLMNHHLVAGSNGEQTLFENADPKAYPCDFLNSEANHTLPAGKVSRNQNWQGRELVVGYEHCSIAARGGWFKSRMPHSPSRLFELYKEVRLNGGNLLLNVGPRPDGTVPGGFTPTFGALKKRIDDFEASLEE